MAKPQLAAMLGKELKERHGALTQAAGDLGIAYDRLRKALQQNRFSSADLELLMPGEPITSLREAYAFKYVRPYRAGAAASDADERFAIRLFESLQTPFALVKRAASETDFVDFVENLYEGLQNASMVLFSHETAEPVEWKTHARDASRNIKGAIARGGYVLYIMESDLKNQVKPQNESWDGVDDDFRWFLKVIEHAEVDSAVQVSHDSRDSGFVALLRVPHCSFCIPHQKPALFSRVDVSEGIREEEHYAVTTVDIPTSWEGQFVAGTAIIPMKSDVTLSMRNYLFQLAIFLRDQMAKTSGSERTDGPGPPLRGHLLSEGLRLQSFPPSVDWVEILRLLERIADL